MRLFLAFDVPERPGWHMTVVFLGAREEEEVPAIERAAARALAPAGPLEPRRFLELPRRRPRVLAVEYADPTGRCGAIQRAAAGALAQAALLEPERRRWLPHVSIARLRDRPPDPPPLDELGFTPERLVLYESHLGRGPARYEALSGWDLPPA